MKYFFLAFLLVVLNVSCDDNSGDNNDSNDAETPSAARSEYIYTGDVVYNRELQRLETQVEAIVKNSQGVTLAEKVVLLDSQSDNLEFEPQEDVSDQTGNTNFMIGSTVVQEATVVAQAGDASEIELSDVMVTFDEKMNIDFDYDLSLVPLDINKTDTTVSYNFRITLEDANGPIQNATVDISDSDTSSEISPTQVVTGNDGRANFSITSSESGMHQLGFKLAGLANSKTVNFEFEGTLIGGYVSVGMHYPLDFYSARVALMALNVDDNFKIDMNNPIKNEIVSETTCPCPEPAQYQLNLPLVIPQEQLVFDATDFYHYGFYAVTVYEDLNGNQQWDEGEYLMGVNDQDEILRFVSISDVHPNQPESGWAIVDGLEDRNLKDWETFSGNINVVITRSPIFEPELSISATAIDDLSNLKMGLFLVDRSSYVFYQPIDNLPGGVVLDELIANDALVEYFTVNIPADGVVETSFPSPEVVFELPQINAARYEWTTPEGYELDFLQIMALVYRDTNSNGVFDGAGELVAEPREEEYGASGYFIYILNYPEKSLFHNSEEIYFHQGYNYLKTPKLKSVDEIDCQEVTPYILMVDPIDIEDATALFALTPLGDTTDASPLAMIHASTPPPGSKIFIVQDANPPLCSGQEVLFTDEYQIAFTNVTGWTKYILEDIYFLKF